MLELVKRSNSISVETQNDFIQSFMANLDSFPMKKIEMK